MANAPEQAIQAAPANLKAEGYRLIEKQTASLPTIRVDMEKNLKTLTRIENIKTTQLGYMVHILRPECTGIQSNGTPTPPPAPLEDGAVIPASILHDPRLARQLGFLINIGGREVWTNQNHQQRIEANKTRNAAKQQ